MARGQYIGKKHTYHKRRHVVSYEAARKPFLADCQRQEGDQCRPTKVFSEVPFYNSAEYGILYGIDLISRNSAKFFTVQYREIHIGSCIRNSGYHQMKIPSIKTKEKYNRNGICRGIP